MFGLGKLGHWIFDLVAISTVIAGIKRSTGYAPHTQLIKDPSFRGLLDSYFSIGDHVFAIASGYVVNSQYFKRRVE